MPFLLQVFDILDVNPSVFVQYGLGCLENLASLGDDCARKTRQNLRIVVNCWDSDYSSAGCAGLMDS